MKRNSQKYFSIALILLLVMTLSSCLGILGGILGGVDTFFSFVDSFGTETLPENVVYGAANELAVGFDKGDLVAFWDYDDSLNYKVVVTKDEIEKTFLQADEEDAVYFENGKFDLNLAGYTYGDNLDVTLYPRIGEEFFDYSVTYNYQSLTKTDYDTFTKNVCENFDTMDYYIASRYEFFEYFSYLIIFRPDAVFTSYKKENYYMLNQNAYIGYDFLSLYDGITLEEAFDYEMSCAISSFEDSAAYNYGYEIVDNVASFKLKFYYGLDPTHSTNTYSAYTNNTRGLEKPHYSIALNERVFPIDSREGSIKVTSTDQLYFVIKKGYKPDCVPGSNAHYIYERMRYILSNINIDSTSDPLKVHYIYDYLVNTVLYDYDFIDVTLKASNKNDAECFAYKCLYMEGVFGFETNKFAGNRCVAICDGLSKAFLCMTQIEGIESIKVSGSVNGDAHAWNKVKIGSKWYLVDITWGNKLEGTKEYLSHEYLMVADDSRHIEDKWYAYPKATGKSYFSFN